MCGHLRDPAQHATERDTQGCDGATVGVVEGTRRGGWVGGAG